MTTRFIDDKLILRFIINKPVPDREKLLKEVQYMAIYKMGVVEAKFADLIWELEPVGSGELVQRAAKELGWKKPTTYTVLRKLCEKGIFHNEKSIVSSVMTREQYYGKQCKQFVTETFEGSLPKFLAAFTAEEKLTEKELDALKKFVQEHEE